jgi:hypothetical protein
MSRQATIERLRSWVRYNFPYFIKCPREARAGPGGGPPHAFGAGGRPLGRSELRPMSRSPHRAVRGQDNASGGGSAGTGMEGAPSPTADP